MGEVIFIVASSCHHEYFTKQQRSQSREKNNKDMNRFDMSEAAVRVDCEVLSWVKPYLQSLPFATTNRLQGDGDGCMSPLTMFLGSFQGWRPHNSH